MFQRLFSSRLPLTALTAGLLLSCASVDRMWRISPMTSESSSERVNAWPIAYHDRGATSFLWPLLDVDERGFALRPLVAKDDAEWGFLYPYSSWDTATGLGWVFPFYRFEENTGVFPVANIGEDLSYVGPFWWQRNEAGVVESSGVFPIAGFGSLNYIGPVWWRSKASEPSGGLFPIASFGSLNYVGPFWWQDNSTFGVLPLFGVGGLKHVGPFWWTKSSGGLFPIVRYADGGDSFSVFPLYDHELNEKKRVRTFLLGLGRTQRSEKKRESWLIPLYYDREEADGSDTVLFPFFWKHSRGETDEVITLLGKHKTAPNESSLSVLPLWWSGSEIKEDIKSSWKTFFPFFYYDREGEDRSILTPLGGYGWNPTQDKRYVNVLGPIFHRSRNAAKEEERTSFLWPLFERHKKGDERSTRIAPIYASTSSPKGSAAWYALGLGHSHSGETGSSWRIWPFVSTTSEDESPGLFYDLTLYGQRKHAAESERWLFPLFSDSSGPEHRELRAFFGLGYSSRTSESSRLGFWPLFSRSEGLSDESLGHRLTLVGSSRWQTGSSFHVLGPLLYRTRSNTRDGVRTKKSNLLVFFESESKRWDEPRVPMGRTLDEDNLTMSTSSSFLFDSFLVEKQTFAVWREDVLENREARLLRAYSQGFDNGTGLEHMEKEVRDILVRNVEAVDEGDPAAVREAIASFAGRHTETLERKKRRFPLLFDYERVGNEVDWSGPLWSVMSSKKGDSSSFRLLYYLYHSETNGASTQRDIFPFVTWDTGPEETRFSFLWRLFRYENRGGRRSGNFLFLPWGSSE